MRHRLHPKLRKQVVSLNIKINYIIKMMTLLIEVRNLLEKNKNSIDRNENKYYNNPCCK